MLKITDLGLLDVAATWQRRGSVEDGAGSGIAQMAEFRTPRQEATLGHESAEHSDLARHLMAGVAHHARDALPSPCISSTASVC